MVYDKLNGIDSIRSTIAFARENGLVGGNRASMYFEGHKDERFSLVNVNEEFRNRRELYKIMYDTVEPLLKSRLSCLTEEETTEEITEAYDY